MKDFTLPANIKQIGSIGDGLRIYMEDYVCTFLQQYGESAGFEERLAFLVGKQMVIDGQPFLFINGAIYGKYTDKHEGLLRFTEKSADYAEEMLDEYFPNMEIVGWMQSQPSYGTYLNQSYAAYHLRQFRKANQVMFVMDPLERANAFYTANPVALTPTDRMSEIPGYFIYYEKNTNMHEYMLVNKSVDYTAKPPTMVEMKPVEYAKEEPREEFVEGYDEYYDSNEERYNHNPRRTMQDPEETIRRHQASKTRMRGKAVEQRRNMLAGLCAVLVVITFVMGVGFVRIQDRVQRLEDENRQITIALRNHMALVASGELVPVFAEVETPAAPGNVAANGAPISPENVGTPTVEQPPAPGEVAANGAPISPENVGTPTVEQAPPQAPPAPPPAPAPAPAPPPAPAPAPPAPPVAVDFSNVPDTYTIQPGDSLLGISLYFFQDANVMYEILALNGIEDADHIVAGRTIALPRR